jgi:hypothetical protein
MLKPEDIFIIGEKNIVAKKNCYINIDKEQYRESDLIEYNNRFVIPPILEFNVATEEEGKTDVVYLIFPYSEVNLMKSDNVNDEDENLTIIYYKKGDEVVNAEFINDEFDLKSIARLFQGRAKFINNPATLVNILHSGLKVLDLFYLELVISNMIRDEEGNLCRHTGKFNNATVVGVTEQSKNNSWLSAIAYQNVNAGITKALIKNQDAEMNPVEKIINEKFD